MLSNYVMLILSEREVQSFIDIEELTVAAAQLVYHKALERNVGTNVEI